MPGKTFCLLVAYLCQVFGSLTSRLGIPLITSDGKDFTQTCRFDYPGSPPDPVFSLTWMFDSQVYKTVILPPGIYNDTLTSSDWTGHLGQKLSCTVEERGTQPSIIKSNSYLGSISINPSNASLHEGEETVLNITSTLPIVCPHLPLVLCNMGLNMDVVGGFSGDLLSVDTCSVSLKGPDWDPSSGTVSATTAIASVIDPVVKPDTRHLVSYTVESNILLNPMWHNYTSEMTEVELIDDPFRTCMVTGDSHVVTSIGTSVVIHRDAGDFLFLNATTENGHNVEVQLRTSSSDGVTSGLAFKYDASLIIFNTWFTGTKAIPLVTQGTERPDDLKIYTCGYDYQIVTGDGIQLVVTDYHGAYHFKISIPPLYQLGTNSMCTYNGKSLRLKQKDSEMFRLSRQESLLDLGRVSFFKSLTSMSTKPSYCNCQETKTTCGWFQRVNSPISPVSSRNQCRSFQPHEYDPLLTPVHKVASNWSRPQANKNFSAICQTNYLSETPAVCQALDMSLAHTFIGECSKERMYTIRGPQHILWACEDRLFGNFSNYRQDSHGELRPLDSLGTVTCPSECYPHGNCVAGICVCHPPYHGRGSCKSYPHNKRILVEKIRGGSICDNSNSRCDDVILLVTPHTLNTTKASAKVSMLKFQGGHFEPGYLIFHVDAVYETHQTVYVSLKEILRTLPEQAGTGFMISLTVDGTTFTAPAEYYIYDGRCQQCFENPPLVRGATCALRQDACTINNRCYQAKEINPGDKTQMCDPVRELVQWSSVQ